jgi:hypothetical protein
MLYVDFRGSLFTAHYKHSKWVNSNCNMPLDVCKQNCEKYDVFMTVTMEVMYCLLVCKSIETGVLVPVRNLLLPSLG